VALGIDGCDTIDIVRGVRATSSDVGRLLSRLVARRAAARRRTPGTAPTLATLSPQPTSPPQSTERVDRRAALAYPGDYEGPVHPAPGDGPGAVIRYAPQPDGEPDAGEVVWAWVPYEEDHSRGKDRPVLVIGTDDHRWLLALMLTSKDHDGDGGVLAADPRADVRRDEAGRRWMDLGPGGWDPLGRPSEVRLDRVVRLDPQAVRREGAVLHRELFERVARALTSGW